MKHLRHIKHVWPTPVDLARDLGLPYTTVHSWDARGRIPADHDLKIIAAAKARGEVITLEQLAHARQARPAGVA
ncbi:carph-isopro domain-containing protein [Paracoccus sp. SY]|uniref:carph-isopro domain-containing protein n=1 Tax=Paracoccus sp. SY TaxID=1330255 RepID=UPI0011AEDEA4|nr:bacteriophage CI repressor [Paracoccus sp. SY]